MQGNSILAHGMHPLRRRAVHPSGCGFTTRRSVACVNTVRWQRLTASDGPFCLSRCKTKGNLLEHLQRGGVGEASLKVERHEQVCLVFGFGDRHWVDAVAEEDKFVRTCIEIRYSKWHTTPALLWREGYSALTVVLV